MATLRAVNKKAKEVLDILTADLYQIGDSKKIDSDRGYMAVHIELINRTSQGEFFSVAHYYIQEGDMMRDPDVVFLRRKGLLLHQPSENAEVVYVPVSFRQDGWPGIDQEFCQYDQDGSIITIAPARMKDCAEFCGMWMNNIRQQQDLKNPAFSKVKPS